MKTNLLFAATVSILALGACARSYPTLAPDTSLCTNRNCVIDGAPSSVYYAKFMAGIQGSCADQPNMKFTSMVAQAVQTRESDELAEVHLYLNPAGTYTGAYAQTSGPFGTFNPLSQGNRKLTKLSGKFYLENDKIVIEKIGIGRKSTADEMLVTPISSSPLSMANGIAVSYSPALSDTNETGQTVTQYCAAQPQSPTPVVAPKPAEPVTAAPQPAPAEPTADTPPAVAPQPAAPATN